MPGPGRSTARDERLELQEYLAQLNISMPIILMTGFADVSMAVKGMKTGAIEADTWLGPA
jgi:FixJ family two-component response regulator